MFFRLVLLSATLIGCATHNNKLTEELPTSVARYSMGTVLKITAYTKDKSKLEACLDVADSLNRILSNYIPTSEVEKFNNFKASQSFNPSREFLEFINLSIELSNKTNGAFDITVGSAVKIWQEAAKNESIPSNKKLKEIKRSVGSNLINVNNNQISKKFNNVSLDTGGIGKGFAVDKIAKCLKENGIRSAFIDFGHSSMRALDPPPGMSGWEVRIDGVWGPLPSHSAAPELDVILLSNKSLSVSRAKGKLTRIQNQFFGHIINPKTSTPVSFDRGAFAVTNLAAEAEAITKALIINGKSNNLKSKFDYLEYGIAFETGENYFSDGFIKTLHN